MLMILSSLAAVSPGGLCYRCIVDTMSIILSAHHPLTSEALSSQSLSYFSSHSPITSVNPWVWRRRPIHLIQPLPLASTVPQLTKYIPGPSRNARQARYETILGVRRMLHLILPLLNIYRYGERRLENRHPMHPQPAALFRVLDFDSSSLPPSSAS